ncbi:MAG TPA: hypothetical protein VFW25_01845 [Silvibacterium sp.]|nr:hypothetical protein [Silvibacterium sp.]
MTLLLASGVATATTKSEQVAEMAPSVRIPTGSLGYVVPNATYLGLRYALTTVDFIDNGHLLFTFHVNRLMQRIPDDGSGDNGQMIHAEVVDIGSGKITQQADWRMRDRNQYLWPLNGGKFLVRQGNSLFLTDEHLQLEPYLTFGTAIEAIQLSPDRKMMLLEIAEAAAPAAKAAHNGPSLLGSGSTADGVQTPSQGNTELILVKPDDKTVVARSESAHLVDLPLTDDGFIGLIEGAQPNQWLLRKNYFKGEPKEFGTVRSTCIPTLEALSETVVLSIHCSANRTLGNHVVTAVSSEKGTLWRDIWSDKYIWPEFDYATDGSRFAYESLAMDHPIGTLDTPGQQDVKAEPVGVFDTETGKLELVEDASPMLSGGHNFALSADGRRFAILRGGAIEIYDLPPVSPAKAKK